MKTKKGTIRAGLPLSAVVREVADKLVADDWTRFATEDDTSVYYVLGLTAHDADRDGTADHLSLSIPSGAKVSVIGERQVHAQVASVKSGDYYVHRWKQSLAATGVDLREIDTFVDLVRQRADFTGVVSKWDVGRPDRFEAFINLLRALVLRGGVPVEELATEDERRQEIDAAIGKTYLDELAQLFDGVVRRARPLDELEFRDPLLNEASRCYVYGFFRAAVLLSSAALEKCLKDAIGPAGQDRVRFKERETKAIYAPLVDEAVNQGVLGPREQFGWDPALALRSKEVFESRRNVAHRAVEPTPGEAEQVLTKTREIIEHIRERES